MPSRSPASKKRRIGIFGGSFNPVHIGHLLLAEYALEALSLDQIIFIPCYRPALKPAGSLLPAHLRLKLLRAAVKPHAHFSVDSIEIQRKGVSYTVDTLRHLKASRLRHDQLYFLMGNDAALSLPQWRQAEELPHLCNLVAFSRPGKEALTLGKQKKRIARQFSVSFLANPAFEISSTQIRERIKKGLPITWMVPPACEALLKKTIRTAF